MKHLKRLNSWVFIASMFLSFNCDAWGNVHHYGEGGRGYPGPGGYYGPGYYPGWGGPNVIINVPVLPRAPYYVPECERVEVCNQYDECWIERYCN